MSIIVIIDKGLPGPKGDKGMKGNIGIKGEKGIKVSAIIS